MKNEKKLHSSQDSDAIKKLESSRFSFRSPESAFNNNEHVTYEWLEDCVIRKIASVEFGKDEIGKDTATIKMTNSKTGNKETVYYTTNKTQVEDLRGILEGKVVKVEVTEKDSEK